MTDAHTDLSDHVIIRRTTLADATALGELWELLAEELYPGACHDTLAWRTRYTIWKARPDMNGQTYLSYAAEVAGELVGFEDGYVHYDPYTSWWVGEGIHAYVLPMWRCTKVSTRLHHAIIQDAKRKGIDAIRFISREGEVDFWLKKGYLHHASLLQKELI